MLESGELTETQMRRHLPGVNPLPVISRPGYEVDFSPAQKKTIDQLLAKFAASPFSPPSYKDCVMEVGEDLVNTLIDLEKLMPVSGEVIFRLEDYQNLVSQVRAIIEKEGSVSVAQMRDRFDTSRRYVLAFLEHLDSVGVTVREGDVRKLKKTA